MKALAYEIKAYEVGYTETNNYHLAHCITIGKGKKAKEKAIKLGNEMCATGKYEAIFVDAYNDQEIEDTECVNIPT